MRGERDPLWRVPHADVDGVAVDLAKRAISIDSVEARPVSLRVVRQEDGVVNFERLLRSRDAVRPARGAPPPTRTPRGRVSVKKLLFERLAADFEDRVPQPSVKLQISEARIAAENFGNVRGAKGSIDFTARIGSGGRVHAAGLLVTNRSRSTGARRRQASTSRRFAPISKRRRTSS